MNLGKTTASRTIKEHEALLPRAGFTPMALIQIGSPDNARCVYLKLEGYNSAGSSKDRTARSLIEDAEAGNRLSHSSIVLESTSGNLGVALSFICHAKGYPFVAVVDPNTTDESLSKMRELGARIEMVGKPDDTGGYLKARLARVKELCESSSRYVWLDQYSNPANPLIHYKTTGPEIYTQMDHEVDALFIAVSTGGTLAGIARYFREVSPNTTIVAVDAVGSVIFGGKAGPRRLTGIGSARPSNFIEKSHYDLVRLVNDEDAFLFCRQLFEKTGLKVGGSSGSVLAACTNYLIARPEVQRPVCLCADRGENYNSTIFSDVWLKEKEIVLPDRLPMADILVSRDQALVGQRQVLPPSGERHSRQPVNEHPEPNFMIEEDSLLYLRRTDVQKLCQAIDSVELLRKAFSLHALGRTVVPDETYLSWRNGSEQIRSLGMPGYVGGKFQTAGTKIINSNPFNVERDIPRADGLTLIHDNRTGRILCVMEGAYLSGLRTGSMTMLAAELLACSPVEVVAIIGAGFLAESHIALIAKHLPTVKQVLLYDLRPERAVQLKDKSSLYFQTRDIEVSVAPSAETAIRAADLVIPVTTTTTGYIRYEWLKAGCLIVNVSLDDVEPEVVLKADLLVVDDWKLVEHDDKRLLGRMFRAGQITGPHPDRQPAEGARAVDAEIGEIIRDGKKGRRNRDDIILVNPFGVAIEDVVLGGEIYRFAKAQGIGIQLPR